MESQPSTQEHSYSVCPICDKKFIPARKGQATCSRSCGVALGNMKRAAMKLTDEEVAAHEFVQTPARLNDTEFYRSIPDNLRDLVHELRDNGFNTVDHRNGTIVVIHRIATDWHLFHRIVESNGFINYTIQSYTTGIGSNDNTSTVRFIKMSIEA